MPVSAFLAEPISDGVSPPRDVRAGGRPAVHGRDAAGDQPSVPAPARVLQAGGGVGGRHARSLPGRARHRAGTAGRVDGPGRLASLGL